MSAPGVSLEVCNLRKSWGATDVLMGVDFDIQAGGFLTLLGPSGCGKSTALKLISGLEDVSDGQILIAGQDVTAKPAAERNLGMVFQNYALFPHMSVAENIIYGLKVRKIPKATQIASLKRVAELMALSKLLDRKPAQLSGGQQQRVALARVLVSERPLVLMDEPLSNLDAKLRVEIRSEIRSLNKRLGITVVYVTHDQSEALSMSDKVVLMSDGNAVQIGTPKDLYDRPANTFAASFIGTPPMNLLAASDVALPGWVADDATGEQRDVLVGVRPEAMTLDGQGADFRVPCKVASVEYEGSVFLVHLQSQSGAPFIVAHHGADEPEPGQELDVGWANDAAHLFSKASGQRISNR
ncbi:sn-glycerol-3-phosphate import ATP-binding protein UgpC [Roseobacter fucihabitans]|uniref:Sn-glycerol-3-phosphate import ATP-binding protein UgpC n=1 Tax=Roseobacter fucihabitans TaxID=1537242 RepID=A0ABZ2BTE8_9RHOB|nr:ABC transporter ATP-binding protein [Roseobacter litoralis]MBC6965560.1 sn-glycerol-3-phosphate import ATP-binding protein UgpC [Roseobacter litoralis]